MRLAIDICSHKRRGAGRILIEPIRLIVRGLRLALLVIGRRRTAVADRVVVEVLREAWNGLAVLCSSGRSKLAAVVVEIRIRIRHHERGV